MKINEQKNADIHQCLKRDFNTRTKCSSSIKQYTTVKLFWGEDFCTLN
jgi:hypothetical protein